MTTRLAPELDTPAADAAGSGTWNPFRSRRLNSKQYLERLLNRGLQELEGRMYEDTKREGYYGSRMLQGDADYDSLWYSFLPSMMRDINESREVTPFTFRDFQGPEGGAAPSFDFDMAGPAAGDYGAFLEDARRRGLVGNTAEGDLTRFSDPSFYFQTLLGGPLGGVVNAPDLGSPDFDAMFSRYATQANERFGDTLRQQLDDLAGSAVGQGRIDTGFFDEDTGELASRLSREARQDINAQAINVLGLQTSDLDSRRRHALDRGRNALDAANLSLRAGEASRDAAFEAANQARANRGEARGMFEDDRDTAEERYRDRRDTSRQFFESDRDFGEQRFRDRRDFARGSYEDDRDFAFGVHTDTQDRVERGRDFRADAWGNTLRYGQARSRDAYERYQDQLDRYYDALFGNTDRAQGLYNAKKQREAAFWNSLWGGVTQLGSAALA